MKSQFFFIFIFLTVLTSCKDESKKQVENSPANVVPFYQNVATANNPVVTPSGEQQTTPGASAAAGMNPQHGQPGHRCDIAVGAPLNSAAATPASATTTQQSSQTQNAPAATYTVNNTAPSAEVTPTAEGMNPPHGQPGHRCEIAVGAPLDGK